MYTMNLVKTSVRRSAAVRLLALASVAAVTAGAAGAGARASTLEPGQTWLPGQCIQQFAVPLAVFGPGPNAALPRVDALKHPFLTVSMVETAQQVLPVPFQATDPSCPPVNPRPTTVWAYQVSDSLSRRELAPAYWPGVTIDARRFVPTVVTYRNELPSAGEGGILQGLISVDQTIHWADPFHLGMMNPCMDDPSGPGCGEPYTGPVPTVPHLHGAEVPSRSDGGPEAWFTNTGLYGADYNTFGPRVPGQAVFVYPNAQEPGTLWFHDHALGATRTNVYSGLEAFYFIRQPFAEPRNLPDGPYEIELAIQDRQFDTEGQLYFPDGSGSDCGGETGDDPCLNGPSPNPSIHPFWNPEFIGDVAVVNGSPWPYLEVEPRRYRFRILDGANARMWNLTFGDDEEEAHPPVYLIGADDTYFDGPVAVDAVFVAPGQRSDVVVDFSGLAGKTVTLTNDAPIPYPDGLWPVDHDGIPADQPQMHRVMQFRVARRSHGRDRSCDPAAGGCRRPFAIARLTDGAGHVAPGVRVDTVRQIVLKESEGPGGPLKVLVNNTDWDGRRSASINADFPSDGVSETPRVGATELWEIINLTVDAHPMHTHLFQFQVLSRQAFQQNEEDPDYGYPGAWAAAFGSDPGMPPLPDGCVPGQVCPDYGPPLDYLTPNADGAIGGNPAIGPYLIADTLTPPLPEEAGWRDTAKALPGQVLRLLVRVAPTWAPVRFTRPGRNLFPFDPTDGPGYVWHCHIIDHEDNEMMRPFKVVK